MRLPPAAGGEASVAFSTAPGLVLLSLASTLTAGAQGASCWQTYASSTATGTGTSGTHCAYTTMPPYGMKVCMPGGYEVPLPSGAVFQPVKL